MKCPSCNETLLTTDKKGIEIDYCPNCHGTWLDRKELEEIIERSADYYFTAVAEEPDPRRLDHHRGSPKDCRGLLHSLYDDDVFNPNALVEKYFHKVKGDWIFPEISDTLVNRHLKIIQSWPASPA